MLDPLYEGNSDLNQNIRMQEIETIIINAKNGKSSGIDNIPYVLQWYQFNIRSFNWYSTLALYLRRGEKPLGLKKNTRVSTNPTDPTF